MKISVNDQEIFSLTDLQKKVLGYVIADEEFEEDMKRRLQWVLMHKYEHTLQLMKNEWIPKLQQAGISMIPVDSDELAALIVNQPDFKSRTEMNQESQQEA